MKGHVNIIYGLAIAALMTLGNPTEASAQEYANSPVEISKERVRIDGKICYSHIVQEKQTLYSISKAYEVSLEDIYKYNPAVKESGLKKNSVLIIPSKEALKETKEDKETIMTVEQSPQEKEKEEVKTEEKKLVIVQDTEPVIIQKQDRTPVVEKQKKKAKRIHIAKWYEDLDVIAEHYDISVEEIMKANNLKGRKLAKRQKLIIPYPGEITLEEMAEEAVESQEDTTVIQPADSIPSLETAPKNKVDATLILPLTDENGQPGRNNMDFYCGALLAVYDMSQKGIDCNLNVYDIMDSKSIFSKETIQNSDIVIGPISSADIVKLHNTVSDPKAVVSPLDPRAEKLTMDYSCLIQAPTPHSVQYQDLVNWIEADFREGDRVMMITEKGARQGAISAQIKEALDSSSLAYNPFSYSILEGRDVTEPLTALLTAEGANRIVIASESEAFVNDVVRNLNLLIFNNLDIVLYAPSKIRSFETIEVENFHNTSMHVSLGYYIDYDSDKVKDFLMKYRALYNTEPTQFAFQGYDLTMYFMEMITRYGNNWKSRLQDSETEMLQSTFRFVKNPSGSYTNNGTRRIIYEQGYQVRKVQ